MNTCGHLVEFFACDDKLVEHVADFVQEGFNSGCVCIAALTPEHRSGLDRELARRGLSADKFVADYLYIVLDARETLDALRSDGHFDVAEFHRRMGQLISLAAAGGRHVRIVGELVALLAAQGEGEALIELEELWNDLSRDYPFTLYCPYPTHVFESSLNAKHLNAVRALHSHDLETA
jgi:MEDS: MEthanogen/methylotroph, DcmR Sensory domain